MEINVQLKSAGKRGNTVKRVKIALCDNPKTVKELIVFTVRSMLTEFRDKKKKGVKFEAGELFDNVILDETALMDQAASGKIGFGFLKGNADVSEQKAIEGALQAFEDGIVVIFIDGERCETLEDKLELSGKEIITFVKLTMLAGRMW